ncbi:protein pecanex [Episyrphus balteatus]|uniref:protein pecanex n=1 Tax=Episyrphus balteatus TaxID=286459 RepID=UPI00248514C0|nr:protein pecanex [Episyrphus balteatus]
MGSQTLEILRQGVWASLTGGWFYDPHQDVFCNTVHLYLWLFLLCSPFVAYLYFPKTLITWGTYCLSTTLVITAVKIINMALHRLYDKAQAMSESNLKNPFFKGSKDIEREEECGIEMQVLGNDLPSRTSVDQAIAASDENSILSMENINSTIDLKVDVHRKNSSESIESISFYASSILPATSNSHNIATTYYKDPAISTSHSITIQPHPCSSRGGGGAVAKSKSELNTKYLAVYPEHDDQPKAQDSCSSLSHHRNKNDDQKLAPEDGCGGGVATAGGSSRRRRQRLRLERQNSLDAAAESSILSRIERIPRDSTKPNNNSCSHHHNTTQLSKSTRLQRHRSSETHDERQKHNSRHLFLPIHHEQPQSSWILGSSSDMYLEDNCYTKSDLGIEKIEGTANRNKVGYLMLQHPHHHQPTPMRKDSNSTMSALQLPVSAAVSINPKQSSMKKRRHSNATSLYKVSQQAPSTSGASTVRRIKSAALEISCPHPSVSNLTPHPNSVEAISGQQIKNPLSALLPPPSKCLVRNPHLNLCPKFGSFTNSNMAIMEPVYPIVEQADEKTSLDLDSLEKVTVDEEEGNNRDDDDEGDGEEEDDDEDGGKGTQANRDEEEDGAGAMSNPPTQRQRCSTTESESEVERPRAHSTDSETDNNGSRSPLLTKSMTNNQKQPKPLVSIRQHIIDINRQNNGEGGDSGCPSSDCEQVSASSKDMLLAIDVKNPAPMEQIPIQVDQIESQDDKATTSTSTTTTGADNTTSKNLGAIPKVVKYREINETGGGDDGTADGEDANDQQVHKRKTASRTSSSTSSRSLSEESFSNDIYKTLYKDHWVLYSGNGGGQAGNTASSVTSHHHQHHHHYPYSTNDSQAGIGIAGGYAFDGEYMLPLSDRVMYMREKLRRSSKQISDPGGNSSILEEEFPPVTLLPPNRTAAAALSIQGLISDFEDSSAAAVDQNRARCGTAAMLNVEPHYCDYWRPACSLATAVAAEKAAQPKRFYKYQLNLLGAHHEVKIEMDRLQLLALFDRDLHWCHVLLAIVLSTGVSFFGAIILQLEYYRDLCAFLFCAVIAGSQYSLMKSVQPDAASPIHGFNKTVAYSRAIYFTVCSALLLLLHHTLQCDAETNTAALIHQKFKFFGIVFVPEVVLGMLLDILCIVLLSFPIIFSLGLLPQINTFSMYFLEQVDMHIFGGNADSSLLGAFLCVIRSMLGVMLLYGPLYAALVEGKGTQFILFSIFCGMLIPLGYHLSRSASDFSHLWALIKTNIASTYRDDDDELSGNSKIEKPSTATSGEQIEMSSLPKKSSSEEPCEKNTTTNDVERPPASLEEDKTSTGTTTQPDVSTLTGSDSESPDPLPKKLQYTVNTRLKNDLVVTTLLATIMFGLHCSTVFTVLQPDLNVVLYSFAGVFGLLLHYVIPQMRKHMPWLCFARPILRQNEFAQFEVSDAAKVMWFEKLYIYLCMVERNVLFPLIAISALTADSKAVAEKFGVEWGTLIIAVCSLKFVRNAYSDATNQYLIIIFTVLFFKVDFVFASETFLIDYFFVSLAFRKCCDFLLKLQFIVTYIAPWQITWGSAFHAFAQPFSVPHSAMLFLQAGISAVLSTPLNPFLGSAIFLTSYVRPIKFWERDYNTRRIDHSNTRLSSQLERDLGADDNNLNSIFYEHLTRSLQHSLCGDLLMGRWGNVNQGDCFVLASDYLNCLVHIIELGNGLCTFQMRGLEFRGTYCQQREVEAITEGVEDNDGCCCCDPGHLPRMLSANAMFSTRWLAWQVVAAQYVLEGYSISDNLASATLQVFEYRKVLITYYIKSIIYYVVKNPKVERWLSATGPIQDSLADTLNRQFVDLDPIFNYNLDEDFDLRALGITRSSFCSVYLSWIQFCCDKKRDLIVQPKEQPTPSVNKETIQPEPKLRRAIPTDHLKSLPNRSPTIARDSSIVSLCLALGLLARRSLATASHSSLTGVEFFLHGLHALFKGDFRITSPRDEWVFADMDLLHAVVAPAVKMALKLQQDHISNPDEYLDPAALHEAITSYSKDLVISHEADPVWRSAVLRGAPNLLALRHVMEDGSDEYRIIRLTKRFLSFRVIKLNRECVRGLWAGQQQELIYLRNRNPERGSIQNAKQALRNIINSSCDQPIGYPIYVSPLTTSYADTNDQLSSVIGGPITLESIKTNAIAWWHRVRERCREGCSSGSATVESTGDTIPDIPSVYFSPATANNPSSITYGSQSLAAPATRSGLVGMHKPTSSTLLAGLLNRERESQENGPIIREPRVRKGPPYIPRGDRERRATLPITSGISTNGADSSRELNESMGGSSTTSELRRTDFSESSQYTKMSTSSGNLGIGNIITTPGDYPRKSKGPINLTRTEIKSEDSICSPIELNKKVIIVDGMEIYDCLDMGRRIDVVWPNEKMRANGGRLSWNDWSPQEGMVGYVVHYWSPNHADQRFRSHVNRTLYLIEIGEHYVPVGERGIKEYNQIVDNRESLSRSSTITNAIELGSPAEEIGTMTTYNSAEAIVATIDQETTMSESMTELTTSEV